MKKYNIFTNIKNMEKYNHSLQYKLALDAVHTPVESISYFPEQLKHAELIIMPILAKNKRTYNKQEVRFITHADEKGICDVSATLIMGLN